MNLMQEEYFISAAIEEGSIQIALWNASDGSANIVSVSNPVSYDDDETMVRGADEGLSSCIQNLPENASEPSKTVFGVPSYWVADGQIQKQYLDKIRLICNKLSLSPSGFVVLPEAIAHYKKSEEGTPLTGILIGIYKQSIDVSLFKLGNLSGTVNVARSVNIVDDVVEGLARFDEKDNLPSQLMLYDSKHHDLEDLKQELIKADWNNLNPGIKFLHTPSVEIFSENLKMAAISLAGGVEIAHLGKVKLPSSKEEKKESVVSDIKIPEENNFIDAGKLGFSIGKDQNETLAAKPKIKLKIPNFSILNKFRSKFKENTLFIIAVSSLVLIIIGFIAFWFIPKADVTIIVSPVKIDEKKQIKFDPKADGVDLSKLVVPVKEISTQVTADKTKSSSGTKIIGNPAKGSVTFYNVGGETTIPQGTVLTSSNLTFSLDSDVQIASAAGVASPATAKGNITAQALGADSNLASGSIFSVGNFSSNLIQAKNDSDLSGGSSQEVTAVSSDDIDSLKKDLLSELTNTGKDNLKQNLTVGDIIIDNSVIATASSVNSDHDPGEEASTVKVTVTAKVTALSVSKEDMAKVAQALFKDKIKPGLVMENDQIDYIFDPNDVEFKINLLPSIDTQKLANELAGKSVASARSMLSSLQGYKDAQFVITPSISFLQILPHMPKNISISLGAD